MEGDNVIGSSVNTGNDDLDLAYIVNEECEFLISPLENDRSNLGTDLLQTDTNPIDSKMYEIHRDTITKLLKLRNLLNDEREQLRILEALYSKGKFKLLHENFGQICSSFIDSQLKKIDQQPSIRNWTEQDKIVALSIYKRGPRLYKYLIMYFDLPSIITLKRLLLKIQFDSGLHPSILGTLKREVAKMSPLDKYCGLLFDVMPLASEFYYEASKQKIHGYQDLGSFGQSFLIAKYALVFMIRGLRKPWKQVIAYYFIGCTISCETLKKIIVDIITQLQNIGLILVNTVCNQHPTFQKVLEELCKENSESTFYFLVNNRPIVTIFDVPYLLKHTRNVFSGYNIKFEHNKIAKFRYIIKTQNMDEKKRFKTVPKLKANYFSTKDTNVKAAASQLSSTVAAGIESLILTKVFPPEAIHTAEFVSTIDDLFDSLNSSELDLPEGKRYRCGLTNDSSHISFWTKLLPQLKNWKVTELHTGRDRTENFGFIEGWQITIKSVMFLWAYLQKMGFEYLNLRLLNSDPLENFLYWIKQHNVGRSNPTCFQFVSAFKTSIVNNFTVTFQNVDTRENDDCTVICSLTQFLKQKANTNIDNTYTEDNEYINSYLLKCIKEVTDDKQVLSNIAAYVLDTTDIIKICKNCRSNMFLNVNTEKRIHTSVKSYGQTTYLVSKSLTMYLQNIYDELYNFLEEYSYVDHLEDRFKYLFQQIYTIKLCDKHETELIVLNKIVSLLIYNYVISINNELLKK